MKTKTLMFLSTAALLARPVSAKLPAPGDAAKAAEFVYPPSAPPATVAHRCAGRSQEVTLIRGPGRVA